MKMNGYVLGKNIKQIWILFVINRTYRHSSSVKRGSGHRWAGSVGLGIIKVLKLGIIKVLQRGSKNKQYRKGEEEKTDSNIFAVIL